MSTQQELIGIVSKDVRPLARDCAERIPDIPGLTYRSHFLSKDEQVIAADSIDSLPWRKDLERRVQHYGWRYDYKARGVGDDTRIGPLPDWLQAIGRRLRDETGAFDREPDQAIVNEYLPGQGIAMHVDRDCFGPAVATVSLGDAWRMGLRRVGAGKGEGESILLGPGSALVLSGEARYRWQHGIARRKNEIAQRKNKQDRDIWRPRLRRVSVTFRTVLASAGAGP